MTNPRSRSFTFLVAAIAFGAGTVAAMALYANITKRKMEAESTSLRISTIDETTIDAAEWGKSYPREYDGYVRTSDNARARFRWSEAAAASRSPLHHQTNLLGRLVSRGLERRDSRHWDSPAHMTRRCLAEAPVAVSVRAPDS